MDALLEGMGIGVDCADFCYFFFCMQEGREPQGMEMIAMVQFGLDILPWYIGWSNAGFPTSGTLNYGVTSFDSDNEFGEGCDCGSCRRERGEGGE